MISSGRGRNKKVRNIDSNQHEQWNRKYPSNMIRTTRYTWWSFLPLALFLQFSKVVNCFYVVNTILQSIPSISTNDPIYAFCVLLLLIFIGVLKEGLADYKRYKTDKGSNATPTQILTGNMLTSLRRGSTKQQISQGPQDEVSKCRQHTAQSM